MKPYLALMFCREQDLRTYAPEVLKAIQAVAGTSLKRAESAAHITAIGFKTDKEEAAVIRAFQDLWRPEMRTWVLPLDRPLLVDKALMEWAKA